MAKARQVFGDLSNHVDEITSRGSLKAHDASKVGAYSSPAHTTDFHVLEDTPDQARSDKCGIGGETCQEFDTPQKVPPIHAQKTPQPELNQVFDDGWLADLNKELSVPESVAACAADLVELWDLSARTESQRILVLLQRFVNMGPHQGNILRAVLFSPPKSAPPPPHKEAWPHRTRSTAMPNADASAQLHDPESHEAESSASAASASTDVLPTVRRTLASRKLFLDDIEYRSDAALEDLVHQVLRSSQEQSEHSLPNTNNVLMNFSAEEREKALIWLFQVCVTVNFQDSVLYLAVLVLDRYCATLSAPVPKERLQLVMVAALSISLKINGAVDENAKPPRLQDLLIHLTQRRFPIQDIFSAEHDILKRLDFDVSTATAADLLDTFLMPHGLSHQTSPVRCIAQFLLQLSLLDVPSHYRYSRAVLAAGAVYVALWVTKSRPEHVSALLLDVSACFNNNA